MTSITRSLSAFNSQLRLRGFNVFQIGEDENAVRTYSRKDFYKICLTTGRSKIHYADRSYEHDGTVLFFGNPHVPYSWETISRTYVGYTCLFSEEFLQLSERESSLLQSPLFRVDGSPVLKISEEERSYLNGIFRRMIEEQQTDYAHKDEVLRNHVRLILHEAMKLTPSEEYEQGHNAAARLTAVFLELLERQFPIESPTLPLQLKTARDYADQLSVHVNYLNRSVKETTGKTTSTLIAERTLGEAKALLQHTDWNVSEIAFALGFDYPTYFNNFFKKLAKVPPGTYRAAKV